MRPRNLLRVLVPLALLAAVAGAALAATGDRGHSNTETITACASKSSGKLRVVSAGRSCRSHEHRLTWNVRGLKGDPGPAGPIGATGPAGEQEHRAPRANAGRRASRERRASRARPARRGLPVRRAQRVSRGPAGPQGEPGRGLTSFDELAGLPCTADGSAGTVSISYGAGGEATIVCVIGGGGEPTSAIRVNEVMTGMTGAAANEFVELVNAGSEAVDVGGYRVVYRSAAGTSDTLLGALPAGTILTRAATTCWAAARTPARSRRTSPSGPAWPQLPAVSASAPRTARSSTPSATGPRPRTASSRARPPPRRRPRRAPVRASAGCPTAPTATTTPSTSPSAPRRLRAGANG